MTSYFTTPMEAIGLVQKCQATIAALKTANVTHALISVGWKAANVPKLIRFCLRRKQTFMTTLLFPKLTLVRP